MDFNKSSIEEKDIEATDSVPQSSTGPGIGFEDQYNIDIDHVAEKKLVRKLDYHIVP